MVNWGYLASLGYLAVIIAFFEIIRKKFKLNVEITRKILHILIGFTWVIMDIFWGVSYHQIIMCALFVVINALSLKFKIFSSIERSNEKNHFGTVYYAVAMLVLSVVSFLYPPIHMPFGMAVMCLSFGDGFAPLSSKIFKKHNLKLTNSKTLAGTIACIVFSFLALLVFNVCYKLEYSILSLVTIAFAVGVIELLVGFGLDNFGITFSVALIALFVKLGAFTDTFLILFLVSSVYVLLIVLSKSLTAPASLLAYVMLFVASFSAEVSGFLIFVIPFTLIAVISVVRKFILKSRGEKSEKHRRNFLQVLLNGGIATIMLLLFKIFDKNYFFVLACVSLAEAFADSLASDVGTLSKRPPFDIFKMKTVTVEVSGGVSLLGTISALFGALILAFLSFSRAVDWIAFAFISVFGFVGTFIDSFFGSTAQALYRCKVCGKESDKSFHCGEKSTLIKGATFVSNNFVNLVSNALTVAISAMILIFVIR